MQPSAWLPAPPLQGGQQGSGSGHRLDPAHHLALEPATADTSVPPVRAHLDVDVQLFDTYPRTPRARVSLQLRQSEMKMLGRERYTQLRNLQRGSPPPFVAFPRSWILLGLHQLE